MSDPMTTPNTDLPAVTEGEVGLTDAEHERLADAFVAANRAEFMDTDFDLPILRAVERILADRLTATRDRLRAVEAAHAALVAGVEALSDEPDVPYPAECHCAHGMGFQFHAYPCRYSREVPRSAVRALLPTSDREGDPR